MPIAKITIEYIKVRSIPNFCDNLGINGENNPNATSGKVFIKPTKLFETPNSSLKNGTNGPIEEIGERSVAPINSTAKNNNIVKVFIIDLFYDRKSSRK